MEEFEMRIMEIECSDQRSVRIESGGIHVNQGLCLVINGTGN